MMRRSPSAAKRGTRRVLPPRWLIGIAGAGLALAGWPSLAAAHPGYPAVVDKSLSLTKTVETIFPPMGCQLCHHSAGGGDQLDNFGSLLVSTYGLSNDSGTEHDSSLEQALIGLRAGDAAAVEDLQHGVNPNDDSAVFAGALPTPSYGCSTGAGPDTPPSWPGLSAVVIVVAGARRRRRGVAT